MGVDHSAKIIYGYKIASTDKPIKSSKLDDIEEMVMETEDYRLETTDYYTKGGAWIVGKEIMKSRETEANKIGEKREEMNEHLEEKLYEHVPELKDEEPGFYLCQVVW